MNAPARTSVADLGRYEVLFRLASGGMAEVFVARQRGEGGFERVVAIKRMLAHLADDERFVDMFLDEARLAAYISSPHVVQTIDVDVDGDGAPFIVMDLVIGLTLAQTLRAAAARKAFIPAAVAVEILAQSADGLHDAHEAVTPTGLALQIVHRDVSPQNTLIGVDGRVRIMDFGVARALARVTKTSTGEFKGKISYFSPEQAEGKELDRRSDIFSHGIVAWETFVGARLFKSDNPLSVLDAIRNQPIPLVSEIRPDVPEAVARVVAKALDRDVTKRYQTAREFSRDLRRAAEATLSESPDSRMVGTYVRDVSGSVLDQMSQRISDAFARQSAIDAERASMPGAQSKSKLRFMADRREIEELSSEPPPPGMIDNASTSAVRRHNPLLDGGLPQTRLGSLDRNGDSPLNSDHPTMVGSNVGRAASAVGMLYEDSIPPPPVKQGNGMMIAGAIALVAIGAGVAYVMTRPDAPAATTTTITTPVAPTKAEQERAAQEQAAQVRAAQQQQLLLQQQQAAQLAAQQQQQQQQAVGQTNTNPPDTRGAVRQPGRNIARGGRDQVAEPQQQQTQVVTNTVVERVIDPATEAARAAAEARAQQEAAARAAAEQRTREAELRTQQEAARRAEAERLAREAANRNRGAAVGEF